MATERMASGDAAWLHMDRPTNELIVNAVLWFDETLTDDVLREAVEKRLVASHARFAQRVDDRGADAWWVDVPDFDAMSQVHRERLGEADDRAALMRRVTQVVTEPLDRDRPLWRIHVIDGFEGATALVARIHHCIADGVALFRVLLSLSDEAQDGALTPNALDLPEVRPTRAARASQAAIHGVRVGRALVELIGLPPDRRTVVRGRLGTRKTVVWTEPMSVDRLRLAARARGATINDLVLAAVTGAVRRWMADTGGPVRDVRAVLPVNLRPLEPGPIELGNRFGLVFLRLPVTATRVADRVRMIRRRTAALKRSATAPVALGILHLAGRAPAGFVRLLIAAFSAKGSVVVTNVPGPPTALHLGGVRMGGVVAWPPQSGSLGVGISLISYGGSAVVGVMADDAVLPDPGVLLAAIENELGVLGVDVVGD